MGFGAGQIVYEDDLAALINRQSYQEMTTVTVNSTTMADIPGSQFAVVAGATYWVQVWLAYDGPLAGDAKFQWLVSDTVNISLDRNIIAPAKTINGTAGQGNEQIPDMIMIRRGTATQQQVGTPAGVVSAFTVYQETSICKSIATTDGTAKLQVAQVAATAPGVTVQSGYMLINRVV